MDISSLLQNNNTSYQDLKISGSTPHNNQHKRTITRACGDIGENNGPTQKRQKVVESGNNIPRSDCQPMPATSVATVQQLPQFAIEQLELQNLWAADTEVPQTDFIEDLIWMRPVRQLKLSGQGSLNLSVAGNLAAALIQITGTWMVTPCEGCRLDRGVFVGCVLPSLEMHPDYIQKGCANHYYSRNMARCSFNISTSAPSCNNDSPVANFTRAISQLSYIRVKDGRREEPTDGAGRIEASGDELVALIRRELFAIILPAGNETVHSPHVVHPADQMWDMDKLTTLIDSVFAMKHVILRLNGTLKKINNKCQKAVKAAQILQDALRVDLAANGMENQNQ